MNGTESSSSHLRRHVADLPSPSVAHLRSIDSPAPMTVQSGSLPQSARNGWGTALRVVMAGPLPPVIGGMTSVVENLANSALARRTNLVLFDTAKSTPEDRPLWQGVVSKLRLWWRWLPTVGGDDTLVHIHTCSGLSYFLDGVLVLLARLRGTPVILHVHGGRFHTFLDSLGAAPRWAAQWIARRCRCVLVLSEEWKQTLATRLPGAVLVVLENGVGVPAPVDRRRDGAQPIKLLFLGSLSRGKGVWDLLKACESVHGNFRLLLVGGEGDAGVTERIVAHISARGLGDRVVVVGPLRGSAKDRQLAEADVFTLPSYAEGLPVAMLESMAAGLPVVVTPVGAIPSIIEHGRNGMLVNPGDSDALAQVLTRLVGDAQLRSTLGAAARLECERRFGIESVADRLLQVYQRVRRDSALQADRGALM